MHMGFPRQKIIVQISKIRDLFNRTKRSPQKIFKGVHMWKHNKTLGYIKRSMIKMSDINISIKSKQFFNKFLRYFIMQKLENAKQKQMFAPLILSGASGVGKGTIVHYLLTTYPEIFQLSVSLTTRQPRNGELNGRQYHFVTKQQFKAEIQKKIFAQYNEVHGNFYGTHKQKVLECMNRNKICILDIDIGGAKQIHQNFGICNFIWLDAPIQQIQKRLRKRGTETEQKIQIRLKNAQKEIAQSKTLSFYHHITNDVLEETYNKILQQLRIFYPHINI